MNANDYAIVKLDAKKKHLVKILKAPNGERAGNGVLDVLLPYETETMKFFSDDIIANLGQAPESGRAYGLKIEPYTRTEESDSWGEIHYFVRLPKKIRREVLDNFSDAHRKLEKRHLCGFFPVRTEIRTACGKEAGSYKYNGKDKEDVFTLHPKEWTVKDLPYIIMHEAGHGVWFRCLTGKQRAKWIKLYHDIVTHRVVKVNVLREMQLLLVDIASEGNGSSVITRAIKELDDDKREVLKRCLKYVKDQHNINPKSLNTLLAEGDELEDFWPTRPLRIKKLREDITKYSTMSPEEYWAEAFALHMSGKKLPAHVKTALEKTLSMIV